MAANTLLPKATETKNTYELLVLLKPVVDTDGNANPAKAVEDALAKIGATVVSTDKMGRRRLPYMINKQKDSVMVSLIADIPAKELDGLRRVFRLNEDVLRVTFLKVTPSDIEAIHKSNQARAQARPGTERNTNERGGDRGGFRRGGNDRGERGGDRGGFRRGPRPDAAPASDNSDADNNDDI